MLARLLILTFDASSFKMAETLKKLAILLWMIKSKVSMLQYTGKLSGNRMNLNVYTCTIKWEPGFPLAPTETTSETTSARWAISQSNENATHDVRVINGIIVSRLIPGFIRLVPIIRHMREKADHDIPRLAKFA